MDYKSVFTNLCLELQQNRSWIKGLGKNPFTHSIPFTHSLTAVPFVRGHRSVFPRTPRNTGVYTRHPTFVTTTSGVLTRLPAKLSKNGMRVYTLSDRRSKNKLRVYASEAKGLEGQYFYDQSRLSTGHGISLLGSHWLIIYAAPTVMWSHCALLSRPVHALVVLYSVIELARYIQ